MLLQVLGQNRFQHIANDIRMGHFHRFIVIRDEKWSDNIYLKYRNGKLHYS